MRTITVKGTGNVSARPDYIILSLNIEVLSETYDRAMSEAAERLERLQGAAVRVGYRTEDLKTTRHSEADLADTTGRTADCKEDGDDRHGELRCVCKEDAD